MADVLMWRTVVLTVLLATVVLLALVTVVRSRSR